MNLYHLLECARKYAEYYQRQGANRETVEAIYVSHLAYLLQGAKR